MSIGSYSKINYQWTINNALQRDCCCLCTPTPKRGWFVWLCMGRTFVDVPGNGVAFILRFGDDIVFAAVFFDVRRWYCLCSCFCICRRQIIYAGRPFGLAGYIESKIVKNVRTNHMDSRKILLKYLQFHLVVCMTTTFESVTRQQHLKQWCRFFG